MGNEKARKKKKQTIKAGECNLGIAGKKDRCR